MSKPLKYYKGVNGKVGKIFTVTEWEKISTDQFAQEIDAIVFKPNEKTGHHVKNAEKTKIRIDDLFKKGRIIDMGEGYSYKASKR